ncbi:MAG: flagellar assembly protein T N-terminal domain-containing protein [Deltaproteobacteria bacterium]|nr:flagellar assembly protein T N-terminal domain-containing protein [Deltaproteobacteria bacterium]
MNYLRGSMCVAALFLLARVAPAATEGVVEAVGEAQIKNGDQVAAKKVATADALKKCIEQVVGIAIKSDFSATQAESVKNNETQFVSDVSDKLVQKSEGFIQKYEVIDERTDKDIIKIKVRAHVFESKIKSEVKRLADLLNAAGNPKVMLVVQEVYDSPEGKRRVAKESLVGAYLEKELLARGFELKGKGEAHAVADDSVEQYDKWMHDVGGAAKMARDQGADILIAGRVEITDKGRMDEKDVAGLDALKDQTRIEIASVIRGLNSATDEIMSTKPVQMTSIGTTTERAVHRAFQGRGENLIKQTFDQLLDDMKESFKKTADRGQAYEVKLDGIKSFKKEGKSFLKVLEGVDGVSTVKQKSFGGGALVVDMACKCSAEELQGRILQAAEKTGDLSSIDIKDVSGKKLAFSL